MDASMILWIIVTFLLSAFFSGMEMAFTSANRLRIELKSKQGSFIARILSGYLKTPFKFLSTLLVGNTIVLVMYSILSAAVFHDFLYMVWPSASYPESLFLLIEIFIISLVLLLFGQYLPKVLFKNYADSWLFTFILPFQVLHYLLLPFSKSLEYISALFVRIFAGDPRNSNMHLAFTKEDLGHFVTETAANSKDEEAADVDAEMFQNALDFDKVKARDCMIPRTDIHAVEFSEGIKELHEKFKETGHSRILIYQGNIDHMIGYVHQVEMFKKPIEIKHILIPLIIAAPSTPVNELLKKFKATRRSIALVVDEFGGTAGIVTMEDVLEQIIGEIDDEHDVEEQTEKQLAEDTFEFSARLEVEYLNETYKLNIPAGEYDTLGGFLISLTGTIPAAGEEIETEKHSFRVLTTQGARIDTVWVKINND